MGYYKSAIKGVGWMTGLRGSTRIMAYVKIAVIARILGPEEFGIFGIAALILALLEILTETGINAFLVQEESDIKKYLNTAWVVSILRGIIISIILFLLAGPISIFFNSPESKNILQLISIVPLLRGFINPAIVRFQKDLEFNKEFYLRSSLYFVEATVAIYLAFTLKSATAFVYGMMLSTSLEILLSHKFVKPRPVLELDIIQIKRIINRGKWITMSGILNYIYNQGDDVIVGKILNTYSLGLYQVAFKISTLPIQEAGHVLDKVTFPVFVKIKGDRIRLKKAFFRSVIAVTIFSIPFGTILFVYADLLVSILLGQDWISTVPVIKVLAIYGVIRSISGMCSSLFLAINKQEYNSMILIVSSIVMFTTIFPLIQRFDIVGAGLAALIGWTASLPLIAYYCYKVLYKVN